jgi:hypothetical protein
MTWTNSAAAPKDLIWAASAFVQVFGRRRDQTLHTRGRSAFEKRQGTKSPDGEEGGAAGAMGILLVRQSTRMREALSGRATAEKTRVLSN